MLINVERPCVAHTVFFMLKGFHLVHLVCKVQNVEKICSAHSVFELIDNFCLD